ncbi:MAG: Lrp/AsnC family transcriptional regulator [Candidatus Omnitrophica bacterium]|nr:Lrp/AsnC family transcriptional regulator [Candidatus Omnitrophota bacterium]
MKEILLRVQEGIPINTRPYKALAVKMGLTEKEVIDRLKRLKKNGLLKKIDMSFDTRKLGLSSTLVGCEIPKKSIAKAAKIIFRNDKISHNYLRDHELNMWFTLTCGSPGELKKELAKLKKELGVGRMVSLPTEKMYKLKMRLNAIPTR